MLAADQLIDRFSRFGVGHELAHRRVREEQLTTRVDDGDGVLELLYGRLEVGHLSSHLRSIGGQLGAHRVEESPQLAELVVLAEIEADAELALTEPREALP